jgi:2-C-methyl-D-erythritol 4-phosphate cytidylyltransferase
MTEPVWINPEYSCPQFLETDGSPVYVIVAAAGSGSRMGPGRSKQFLDMGHVPVIVRSLQAFAPIKTISAVIVVAAAADCAAMQALLGQYAVPRLLAIAAGGPSRQASVANGLAALQQLVSPAAESPVLVHDGARCFVTPAVIERVIRGIREHRACGAAVPVKDTIKTADPSGKVLLTPDRSRLWAMQTPQGACWHLLRAAYERTEKTAGQATDDLAVLEQAGQPVYLVMGDYSNIKLTTPDDLLYGSWLASRQEP